MLKQFVLFLLPSRKEEECGLIAIDCLPTLHIFSWLRTVKGIEQTERSLTDTQSFLISSIQQRVIWEEKVLTLHADISFKEADES